MRHRGTPERRGNTIVLVSAMLVLLVIIATAYITRTQAERSTAQAINTAQTRGANAREIGDMLAHEITQALFPMPVDPLDPSVAAGRVGDSNWPRLPSILNPVRYGVDRDARDNLNPAVFTPDGRPDFAYNFAPYTVVPWTNWPDYGFTPFLAQSPRGPGNPGNAWNNIDFVLLSEGNPLGNPGFGDTRWLCDHEPLRWATKALETFRPEWNWYQDAFSHWRHLSYIGRPNNSWRIATDISDIFNTVPNADPTDPLGELLTNLTVPVEQWLLYHQFDGGFPIQNEMTGDTNVFAMTQIPLEERFSRWFFAYPQNYGNLDAVPPNFLRLGDLNADGIMHNANDRPEMEFVEGSARWNVSRFLTDTDGDGYTDSFWWLAPTTIGDGVRQLVSIRIIDNSAMLDVNAATRFSPASTRGETPADLAIVGQNLVDSSIPVYATASTGLFDNPLHHENYRVWLQDPFHSQTDVTGTQAIWNPDSWCDFLDERGVFNWTGFDCTYDPFVDFGGPSPFGDPDVNRRNYWLASGLDPLNASQSTGLRPYDLSDELELRMYHGQNYPWIISRLERAVTPTTLSATYTNGIPSPQIFHANNQREETSEFLDQLGNRELLIDMRRHVTTYNGARHEEMPPWMRWRWEVPQFVTNADDFLFHTDRKLDLREPSTLNVLEQSRFRTRLPNTLAMALTDGPARARLFDSQYFTFNSYYGPYDENSFNEPDAGFRRTQKLAAAYAANILQYRDPDTDASIGPNGNVDRGAIPLPEMGGANLNFGQLPENRDIRYLGMERQPFITEVFVAHVYETSGTVLEGFNFPGAGENFVHADSNQSTIVVVQLANPYDEEIDLNRYQIKVAGAVNDYNPGNTVTLTGFLPPSTEEVPSTAIFYSIKDGPLETTTLEGWLDFLDLDQLSHHANGTLLIPVDTQAVNGNAWADPNEPAFDLPGTWSASAADYDMGPNQHLVELVRLDPVTGEPVVIDRIDQRSNEERGIQMRDVLDDLTIPPTFNVVPPDVWDGVKIGANTHFVTWARVTRDWGRELADLDMTDTSDWGTEPHERAPRYVFSWQYAHTTKALQSGSEGMTNLSFSGDAYAADDILNADNWFIHAHTDRGFTDVFGIPMAWKPTMFTQNPVHEVVAGVPVPLYDTDFALGMHAYGRWFYGQDLSASIGVRTGMPRKGFRAGGSEENASEAEYYDHSLQMLQKDDDFQQLGELLNVWLYGHELEFAAPDLYVDTVRTFSENMCDELLHGPIGPGVNRLVLLPDEANDIGGVIGGHRIDEPWHFPPNDPAAHVLFQMDGRQAMPAVPAGQRVLDAFVCDGSGWAPSNHPSYDPFDTPRLAHGFRGLLTPGLINVNTAPLEVLRSLPHWYKLVHRTNTNYERHPRTGIAEAVLQYRDRYARNGQWYEASLPHGPDYAKRQQIIDDMDGDNGGDDRLRQDRGVASLAELTMLRKVPQFDYDQTLPDSVPGNDWIKLQKEAMTYDFAASSPLAAAAVLPEESFTDVSTDVHDLRDYHDLDGDGITAELLPDRVAGDHEERNLLFNGASNLLTTRSDVFTVYFRVRSFRRNPVTGVWNALDPEMILDDSRYVMLVDRSEVNHPDDPPKILFFEKLQQ